MADPVPRPVPYPGRIDTVATLPQCARRIVIATEYMGIPTLIQGSLIWTLRHPFVNQGRLNREIIQLGYEPTQMDLCPVGSLGPDDPYLLIMADYSQ